MTASKFPIDAGISGTDRSRTSSCFDRLIRSLERPSGPAMPIQRRFADRHEPASYFITI
jgi:hypothetical protein